MPCETYMVYRCMLQLDRTRTIQNVLSLTLHVFIRMVTHLYKQKQVGAESKVNIRISTQHPTHLFDQYFIIAMQLFTAHIFRRVLRDINDTRHLQFYTTRTVQCPPFLQRWQCRLFVLIVSRVHRKRLKKTHTYRVINYTWGYNADCSYWLC